MYLRLMCAALITFSFTIHAMDQEVINPESLTLLMDALTINSLTINMQELSLLLNSMNLHRCKTKFEKIADLAFTLNVCFIKDSGYCKETEPIAMDLAKVQLVQTTRETLKNIVRLSKHSSPDISLIEQTIHQINCFKLKYLTSTHGSALVTQDMTSKYKEEMLKTLHS